MRQPQNERNFCCLWLTHKKTGQQLDGLKIIDLTPTIRHMFDIAVPEEMDGKVLTQIFERESELAKRKVKYQKIHREKERIKAKKETKKDF